MTDITVVENGKQYAVGAFTFSETGLVEVNGTPSIKETEQTIASLHKIGACVHIWIGDLLNWAEQTYGSWEQVIPSPQDLSGLEIQSIRNAKSVTARVPRELRQSADGGSRTFKELSAVANFTPENQAKLFAEHDQLDESANQFYARLHPQNEDGYVISVVLPFDVVAGESVTMRVNKPGVEVLQVNQIVEGATAN